MTVRGEIAAARDRWRLLTFYGKFEQAVVVILTTLIALVIASAVWNLALKIFYVVFLAEAFDPTDHAVFQAVFGMIFTVIIALEFKRSLVVVAERRESIVQVRTVVLLAMLAILRKLIILDLTATDAGKLLGLSAAMLALGAVYWLVREQDQRFAAGEDKPD
ncbi:phosphate-starvation-inducible PsiE family protein [Desertibaculum subflavum]|uniref:phosphate-starvation-inducible PsiE family protein n=1 Tax=Desertibaculum subflavum TaxID=2268458 RepID=UPI000E66C6B2